MKYLVLMVLDAAELATATNADGQVYEVEEYVVEAVREMLGSPSMSAVAPLSDIVPDQVVLMDHRD